ncbi:MAG: iron-sulfur cluster assembly scaffold protein [Clostridia bacterium]|nr:iron-sulfur cluster assembly scaffold protein [Clostridia bacterium]
MYSKKIMEEFYNPQNYGVIKGASGVGKVVSHENGEIIKIYISVEKGTITDVQFQTFGGVVAIACSSIATALMKGKAIDDVLKVTENELIKEAGGIPENMKYVAGLVVRAMHGSVENYREKEAK